ncbi:MAG: omptin family outer membrane protease [Verrucomicrobiales bacterium]|nr:omptin family outer membrane protease [Verrucomicrobiales bacterium]
MNHCSAALLTCVLSALTAVTIPANDIWCNTDRKICERETRKSTVWAGFGHLNARADEIVYGGPGGANGDELSHLIWDVNNALTFNLGFEGEVNSRWSLFGEGTFSLSVDDTDMVDYDWLYPTTAWSERSTHPDSDLNHYAQVDLGGDFKLIDRDQFAFKIRGAFRYTDIAMDAYGGSGTYSVNSFRDTNISFANRPVISYRQKLPSLYIGPRINWSICERLHLNLGAVIGTTMQPEARDRHWLREIIFEDYLESNTFYGAMAGIDFDLNPSTTLYVEGSYDKYKLSKGFTEFYDPTGAYKTPNDSAGAELETIQIKAGVRIHGWHKQLVPDLR